VAFERGAVEIFAAAGVLRDGKLHDESGGKVQDCLDNAARCEQRAALSSLVRGRHLWRLRVVGATLPIAGAIYRNGRGSVARRPGCRDSRRLLGDFALRLGVMPPFFG